MSVAIPEKADLSKYIEMREGRANIRGRRLPISYIAATQRAQHSTVEELADKYTLTVEQVLAALLYYREHQVEIDEKDAQDVREWEELRRQNPRKPGQS
jgi:uncharacterized protein (DUF433 family)